VDWGLDASLVEPSNAPTANAGVAGASTNASTSGPDSLINQGNLNDTTQSGTTGAGSQAGGSSTRASDNSGAPNSTDIRAQQSSGNTQVTRGNDELRAAALTNYRQLPADMKKKISDTFLDPNTQIYAIKDTPDGRVVSEYQFSIGRYQKKDSTVYYLSTDVAHAESPANESFASIMASYPEWKTSLKAILDFHSHADTASPGFSFLDRGGYNHGARYMMGSKMISVPLDYSGAFYGKEQTFYGWTRNGEYTLTFEEIRNALK
jgi:hypothetical protein